MKNTRFGVIVPWINRTVEDELPLLVDEAVGLHWSRVRPNPLPRDRDDESYLPSLVMELPRAVEELGPSDLDEVIFACTSACFDSHLVLPGIGRPIVTAFGCVVSQLQKNAGKILLCTPYSESLTNALRAQLEQVGFSIANSVVIRSSSEFRDIDSQTICSALSREFTPTIDRILILCTALRTLVLSELLSKDYGITVPVISTVSAMAAHINDHASQLHLSSGSVV
jgi:maleate cis-trans isomerase